MRKGSLNRHSGFACSGLQAAVAFPPLVRREDVERAVRVAVDLGYTVDAGEIPFDAQGPHSRTVRRISKVDGNALLTLDLVILPDWLADVWLGDNNWHGRWRGAISVTAQDPHAAAREIERWAGHPYMAEVLMTRKSTIGFVATPGYGLSLLSSTMAFRPKGVAALPRPRMFEAMFMIRAPMAG